MDRHSDQEDDDDDFSDLYKEYTGPPVLNKSILERPVTNKRSLSGSDEEHEDPDPNAVPTDFTSREKKVWDAKSKATERNWKKRKEEEMICKLCGDSGHFTQGCPSTLGANGKEFFQRVAARDKHVRALFTGKIMTDIEMEIGCKLRLDEKFLFVSGKDRLILAKGVDAVHKLINDDVSKIKSSNCTSPRAKSPDTSPADSRIPHSDSCKTFSSPRNVSQLQLRFSKHDKAVKDCVRDEPQKDYSNSKTSRSRSPDRSSADVSIARADPHKSISSPRIVPQVQPRYNKHDKAMEDCVREDLQRMCKDSPQAYYGSTGARGPSSHSMSPRHRMYSGDSSSMYGSQSQSMAPSKPNECDTERLRSVITTSSKVENLEFTQSFDDLELEFKSEAINLSVIKDKEEDEENYRHREAIREIRELYIKKLSSLRSAHAKQWEEFLQRDAKRRNQQLDSQRQIERLDVQHVASGYGGDRQASFGKYGSSGANVASHQYTGSSYPMDANGRYSDVTDDYVSSRVNDSFREYHRQRRDDVGRNYTRY